MASVLRKSKATGLPVKGNKRKAQAMADAFMAELESKVSTDIPMYCFLIT